MSSAAFCGARSQPARNAGPLGMCAYGGALRSANTPTKQGTENMQIDDEALDRISDHSVEIAKVLGDSVTAETLEALALALSPYLEPSGELTINAFGEYTIANAKEAPTRAILTTTAPALRCRGPFEKRILGQEGEELVHKEDRLTS